MAVQLRILAVCVCIVLGWSSRADADAVVALLPLDADAKLEVYSQPVAAELARAIAATEISVEVVKPKALAPSTTKVIVDGRITGGKTGPIEVGLRLRDPGTGKVLGQLSATAPNVASLDKAAAELAPQVVELVKARLAELARPVVDKRPDPTIITPPQPQQPLQRPILVAVTGKPDRRLDELTRALSEEVSGWASGHGRPTTTTDPSTLTAKLATKTVAESTADRGLAFEVVGFRIKNGKVPVATARVRVRLADSAQVIFDRVVVTDSVVGDRGMSSTALATRTAREVLAIVHAHTRRMVPAWR